MQKNISRILDDISSLFRISINLIYLPTKLLLSSGFTIFSTRKVKLSELCSKMRTKTMDSSLRRISNGMDKMWMSFICLQWCIVEIYDQSGRFEFGEKHSYARSEVRGGG